MKLINKLFTTRSTKDQEIAELKYRIRQLEKELIRERGLKQTCKILAGDHDPGTCTNRTGSTDRHSGSGAFWLGDYGNGSVLGVRR